MKVRRLIAANAQVDTVMLENQQSKADYNMRLMKSLIRHDGIAPRIPKAFVSGIRS